MIYIGIACLVVVVLIVYCAIVLAGRGDEQDRDQLQRDSGCCPNLNGESH